MCSRCAVSLDALVESYSMRLSKATGCYLARLDVRRRRRRRLAALVFARRGVRERRRRRRRRRRLRQELDECVEQRCVPAVRVTSDTDDDTSINVASSTRKPSLPSRRHTTRNE